MLLHYGFCYQSNPYDYVEVQVGADDFYYLKKDRLNIDLLNQLRKSDIGQDLMLEMKTLFLYKEICTYAMKTLEAKTTLEQDFELLNSGVEGRLRYCVIYRYEKKLIMKSQILLCDVFLQVLRAKDDAQRALKDGEQIDFKAIYMEKCEEEKKEQDERAFFERRFKCSQYLVNL